MRKIIVPAQQSSLKFLGEMYLINIGLLTYFSITELDITEILDTHCT